MVIERVFTGGLNIDDSKYFLGKGMYVNALNITADAKAASNDIAITNIVGNRKIAYTLPAGFNQVIGAFPDRVRNRVIYFVYNSNGNHSILECSLTTRTTTKILESKTDTGGIDILGFTLKNKINHVDVIHRDEGDLLFFTDGNVSPKGFIIDKVKNGDYGVIERDFIEVAKRPPLKVPEVSYINDDTRETNALRKKLYQFKYRWVYDDYSKSTWSPISTVPLPANVYTSDADLDATANNAITVNLSTGNKNVLSIELAVRSSTADANGSYGSAWNDFQLAEVIDKAENAITDNVDYTAYFYGDGVFPAIDVIESDLLFDWVPLKAKAQVLANGNTLVYGNITEGYDNISNVNITLSIDYVTGSGGDQGDVGMTYKYNYGNGWTISVTGPIQEGTRYRVYARTLEDSPDRNNYVIFTLSDYTVQAGDTLGDVYAGLLESTRPVYQNGFGGDGYYLSLPGDVYIYTTEVNIATGFTTISSDKGWMWNSKWKFGRVYFDINGRTNGVVYKKDICDVSTGNLQLDSTLPKVPIIFAEVNDTPPSWAVSYMWVRSNNLAVKNFTQYVTCDFQSTSDYYYFGLGNMDVFKTKNDKFIYGGINDRIGDGYRLRVMCDASPVGYGTTTRNEDYEILGIEELQITGGATTEKTYFVKVKKPATDIAYPPNVLVMVYEPAFNSGSDTDTVFWEFDKMYGVYEIDGVLYHKGGTQDQTASQPAKFTFTEGDVYYRRRSCYYDLIGTPGKYDAYLMMDRNYSDFFPSAVSSNGRPQIIDINAKQINLPTTVRFGQSYISGTNVNQSNRFYYENFDDYDRSFGAIQRLKVRDREMRVYQKFKCGSVPVLQQIIKDAAGNDVLAQSDILLNKIQYRVGEYGIGDAPSSLASDNYADYFCDTNRGVMVRWSMDGLTPISILYKVNSWATDHVPKRNEDYPIYGVFDAKVNNYIAALSATDTDSAYTLAFNEPRNVFESFYSYEPEWMCCLGTLLITFKDGELWTHDSDTYNSFYGVNYSSYITGVFNDGPQFKKTFQSHSQVSSTPWVATAVTTSLNQSSYLKSNHYRKMEDTYHAYLLRDVNSSKGLLRGYPLKGNWIELQMEVTSASSLVSLNIARVKYIVSNLTDR